MAAPGREFAVANIRCVAAEFKGQLPVVRVTVASSVGKARRVMHSGQERTPVDSLAG